MTDFYNLGLTTCAPKDNGVIGKMSIGEATLTNSKYISWPGTMRNIFIKKATSAASGTIKSFDWNEHWVTKVKSYCDYKYGTLQLLLAPQGQTDDIVTPDTFD